MAKFVFKLESILSIKYKLEDQAKTEYGLELARLRLEEEKLVRLEEKKEGYQFRLREAVQDYLDISNIRELQSCVEHVKYNMSIQRLVIKAQEQRVEAARQRLDEAMKERKTFEKLKEKAFEQFKIELEAQERKEIDELVSFRFGSAKESEDS